MSASVEFVERPVRIPTLLDAIMATADNGKAMRVPTRSINYVRSGLYKTLRERGLRLHTTLDRRAGILTAWCERLP